MLLKLNESQLAEVFIAALSLLLLHFLLLLRLSLQHTATVPVTQKVNRLRSTHLQHLIPNANSALFLAL